MNDEPKHQGRQLPPPPPRPTWVHGNLAIVEALQAMDDPVELTKAAHSMLADFDTYRDWFSEVRSAGIEELREAGWSYEDIGQLLGLTRSRVQQVVWARNKRIHALDELGEAAVDKLAVDDEDSTDS